MSTARRSIAVTAVVAALMWVVAAPAYAHVGITPEEAPEGSTQEFVLGVGHGCDDSPTIRLTVNVPTDAFDQVEPLEVEGWTLTVSGAVLTWEIDEEPEAGHEDEHGHGDFGFRARVIAAAGTEVPVPLIQECIEGRYDWIQVPAEGQTHDDLEEPAPVVTVTEGEPVVDTTAAPDTTATPTTEAPATTVAPTTAAPTTVAPSAAPSTTEAPDEGGGSAALPIAIGLVAVGGVAAGLIWWRRRNDGTPPTGI